MKTRIVIVLVAVLAVLLLSSCGDTPKANDPAVMAAVMTQAAYTGQSGTTKGVVTPPSKAVTVASSASFAGSSYASEAASAVLQYSLTFTNATVTCNDKAYTVNGTLSYACSVTGSGSSFQITGILYGTNLSIAGPDVDSTLAVDFKETVDMTVTGSSSVSMTCTLNGTVGGATLTNKVTSFTYTN